MLFEGWWLDRNDDGYTVGRRGREPVMFVPRLIEIRRVFVLFLGCFCLVWNGFVLVVCAGCESGRWCELGDRGKGIKRVARGRRGPRAGSVAEWSKALV